MLPSETIPGPAQLKPVPDVVDADRTTDVVVQVSVPPVALAPGGAMIALTSVVAVLVHPFDEFVTVTVYVPEELTTGLAPLPPETMPGPVQLKPVPDVLDAERDTEVIVQLSVPPDADAPGGVVLELTSAVAVLVHPFAEFVTVTVYVPDALTLGFAVVPPETTPAPAQLKPVPVVVAPDRTTDVVAQLIVPPVAEAPGA